ncbi:MAG: sigma-54 interaction domain-containing protein, partial [Mariniblastus sp.]
FVLNNMLPELKNNTTDLSSPLEAASAFSVVFPGTESVKTSATRNSDLKTRNISFQSKIMSEFFELAKLYAKSSATVLVTGESGSGKELFSRLIHQQSDRSEERFIAVNCAAVSESLIESEFFGHEKGAFTGASTGRVGFFEQAQGGTLLLDEISEIPLAMQAKLLRVIEEQEVQPVGSNSARSIDVRIVATTNRDLAVEVAEGRFREDLFHRINVLELDLPPLRDRVSDIPLLVMHFVNLFQSESRTGSLEVDKEAMQWLCQYHWPGNVRELRNVIHRACVIAVDGKIGLNCLAKKKHRAQRNDVDGLAGLTLAEVERRLILLSLSKFQGNKRLAAEELGVTARTLSNKLKVYSEESGIR